MRSALFLKTNNIRIIQNKVYFSPESFKTGFGRNAIFRLGCYNQKSYNKKKKQQFISSLNRFITLSGIFMKKIAVIGGGAAGLMAAGTAHENGAEVTVFEKNSKFGRKIAITGKGRCNLTNDCSVPEFIASVVTNPKFLYSSISAFSPADTMRFFEERKVKLKTERGGRVFPESDRAYDIVDALGAYASRCHVVRQEVTSVDKNDSCGFTVACGSEKYLFDSVIICTGGASYPLTGSTGDGYTFAQSLGHTVVPIRPSLVPIETKEAHNLSGLTLKNVNFSLFSDKKTIFSKSGELLFTHFGISGPLVLSATAYLKGNIKGISAEIDMKPALDTETLLARVRSDFEKYKNRNLNNALSDLLPMRMIPEIISASGISEFRKINTLTAQEILSIVKALKHFPVTPTALRPIDEAIVTGGGVSVKEINPKTMESKLIKGLYFAGEVIDVDALTGGFNLQIAFSTGRSAGLAASQPE